MTITSQNLELRMYVPSSEPKHWLNDYRFVIAAVNLCNHTTLHIGTFANQEIVLHILHDHIFFCCVIDQLLLLTAYYYFRGLN